MAKVKQERKARAAALHTYLAGNDVMATLRGLTEYDLQNPTLGPLQALMAEVAKRHGGAGKNIDHFIRFGCDHPNSNVAKVFTSLKFMRQAVKAQSLAATHQQRRSLVYKLGLNRKAPSWKALLRGVPVDAPPYKLERRDWNRCRLHEKLGTEILDTNCRPNCVVANSDTGFRVVGPEESVIFWGRREDGTEGPILVVIRNVGGDDPVVWERLQDWLNAANLDAISNRRNVRPTHGGEMVQWGYNGGPRHARIFGFAKSFTKKLDEATKIMQDVEVVGAASLVWRFARSYLPTEIMDNIEAALDCEEMPRIATANVPPADVGFTLVFEDQEYFFANEPRAPPECYASREYTAPLHKDKTYCPWVISYNVVRQSPHEAQRRYGKQKLSNADKAPVYGGGNYVDVNHRIVVVGAAGTLMAHRGDNTHGTTTSCGWVNAGFTIAFFSHLRAQWVKAKQGIVTIVSSIGGWASSSDTD